VIFKTQSALPQATADYHCNGDGAFSFR